MNKINQGIILFKMNRSLLSDYFSENQTKTEFRNCDSWVILSPIEQSIKRKIEEVGTPLKDWDINIYRGILTGYNEAFIISGEKRTELLAACGTEKERIRTDELIRPILRGRDIKRYNYEFADLWLINTHNGIKEKGISRIDIDDYPTIKAHLDQYWDQISTRADKGDTPYNLRNCAYMDDFNKQKIIYPEITKFINFFYDKEGYFLCNNKCFILTGSHLAFLTAFFNSKLFRACFRDNFPELLGGTRELRKIFIEEIPILTVNDEINNQFDDLISLLDHSNPHQIKEIFSKCDSLIFDLYTLTEEEIKVIESS